MAKATEQFGPGDVTLWGIITLSIWAVAVLGANVSGILPSGVYGALHASRLDGGTINQLRSQVASLEQEATRMRRENDQLLQRFTMSEEESGAVTRRVGALEMSLPKLLEQQRTLVSQGPAIDTTTTGSIGTATPGKIVTFEADGGTVAVQQKPLFEDGTPHLSLVPLDGTQPAGLQQMAAVDTNGAFTGVALGFPIAEGDAEPEWQELLAQAGDVLGGLSPVLSPADSSGMHRIVAGPLADHAAALSVCERLDTVGTPCEVARFDGEPIPLLN